MRFLFKNRSGRSVAGFSLLEMMVVTAIFVVVTGVILANLPRFRNRSSLDLTAQEIALTIREAQVYGTATRVAGADLYPSYGVHFELNGTAAKKFILFADRDSDDLYDPGDGACNTETTECLEEYNLSGQFEIVRLFASAGGMPQCYAPGGGAAVDAVYTRPFPEPAISLLENSQAAPGEFTYAGLRIGVPGGEETRDIIIWNNGQISAVSDQTVDCR